MTRITQDPVVTFGDTGLFTFQLHVEAGDGLYEANDVVRVKVLPEGYVRFGKIISAAASSTSNLDTVADNIIDDTKVHTSPDMLYISTASSSNWISSSGQNVADQYLEFELAGKYNLHYIRLWNLNAVGDVYKGEGVKDMDVMVKENAGDDYVSVAALTLRPYLTDWYDRDMSEVFAINTSSFVNGVKFVKLAINSSQAGDAEGKVGLNHVAVSGTCIGGNIVGDLDNNCHVDMDDFALFAAQWLNADCGICGGANFDGNINVDEADLEVLSGNWLR